LTRYSCGICTLRVGTPSSVGADINVIGGLERSM